ncbi:glycosyltransferase family 4 protein, partial [Frankia sp. R82]|uniref:glycosyltransferase family 4 protein n=1 Tax=Frankia sp. R82 TaxID=2950553 RepID=UPI002043181E
MRVVVATEARFHRDAQDVVVSRTPSEAYRHWASYLGVFDEVVVLGRVGAAPRDEPVTASSKTSSFPVAGTGVRVVELPPYQGLVGYLRTRRRLRRAVADGFRPGGALAPTPRQRAVGSDRPTRARQSPHVIDTRYLAVMPGLVGATLIAVLRRRDLPYAMEIIGDAEAVAGGMFGRFARRPARRWLARRAVGARAVGYVTRETLQARYPAAPGALQAHYAYGRLGPDDFTPAPRPRASRPPTPATVVTIGSQERRYKGHDILLTAAGLLDAWKHSLRVVIVGSGRHHDQLVRAAQQAGLDGIVEFVPTLDRAGVRALLDDADLFVLPSRTEGLPRVVIEALARGVPTLGTAVGGTVELLAHQDLVPPEDPLRLAIRMSEVLTSPALLAQMSARNRAAAEEYRGDRVDEQASAFYRAIVGWDAPDRARPTAHAPATPAPTAPTGRGPPRRPQGAAARESGRALDAARTVAEKILGSGAV